jgi:hypothetical protein
MADELLCPSAPAAEGALVIGVVSAEGTVEYLRDRLPATRRFLEIASVNGSAERRYRFSSPCQECACAQWADGACSLPRRLAEVVPEVETSPGLPRCAIRARCRWFHQSGADACHICPVVTTRDDACSTTEGSTRHD